MRNAAVDSEIRREEMIIMAQETFTTINNLRCTKSTIGLYFTEGKIYPVNPYFSDEGNYMIMEDSGATVYISPETLQPVAVSGYQFEIAEGFTSTAEEDEEFQRIERKQQETVDCSVVVAHHIHELQKWLKHIGCDDEMELKITSDGLWVSPCAEELYGVKEGGVGTLIEYMRHIGGANKCLEKMEEL